MQAEKAWNWQLGGHAPLFFIVNSLFWCISKWPTITLYNILEFWPTAINLCHSLHPSRPDLKMTLSESNRIFLWVVAVSDLSLENQWQSVFVNVQIRKISCWSKYLTYIICNSVSLFSCLPPPLLCAVLQCHLICMCIQHHLSR